jgi:hypothetical protein
VALCVEKSCGPTLIGASHGHPPEWAVQVTRQHYLPT